MLQLPLLSKEEHWGSTVQAARAHSIKGGALGLDCTSCPSSLYQKRSTGARLYKLAAPTLLKKEHWCATVQDAPAASSIKGGALGLDCTSCPSSLYQRRSTGARLYKLPELTLSKEEHWGSTVQAGRAHSIKKGALVRDGTRCSSCLFYQRRSTGARLYKLPELTLSKEEHWGSTVQAARA